MSESPELEDLEAAHDASLGNRSSVLMAEACGCFSCLATFAPEAVDEWGEERDGRQTALCPRCGVDSVLPVGEGVGEAFLRRMQEHYFYRVRSDDASAGWRRSHAAHMIGP